MLTKYICDRRVCIEVCLTSNLDTMPGLLLQDHAFSGMISHGVSVCLCTDNRLMSNTTTVNEISKAVTTFKLNPKQLQSIVMNGFKKSFYCDSYLSRREYVHSVGMYYEAVAAKFGVV